jgi:hypothetical protein
MAAASAAHDSDPDTSEEDASQDSEMSPRAPEAQDDGECVDHTTILARVRELLDRPNQFNTGDKEYLRLHVQVVVGVLSQIDQAKKQFATAWEARWRNQGSSTAPVLGASIDLFSCMLYDSDEYAETLINMLKRGAKGKRMAKAPKNFGR